ncbi:hypothetical protein DWV00_26190 [Trinickia dinghuensis]|uniref:Uncharacterized protein n=1 Tax=Trinickia dinghuensis TaxID=2291023 RepID=A0A3D8JSM1_9BURK|nr:hypothetical protein DWV00_26190 [Trinickia dinghuensis]
MLTGRCKLNPELIIKSDMDSHIATDIENNPFVVQIIVTPSFIDKSTVTPISPVYSVLKIIPLPRR